MKKIIPTGNPFKKSTGVHAEKLRAPSQRVESDGPLNRKMWQDILSKLKAGRYTASPWGEAEASEKERKGTAAAAAAHWLHNVLHENRTSTTSPSATIPPYQPRPGPFRAGPQKDKWIQAGDCLMAILTSVLTLESVPVVSAAGLESLQKQLARSVSSKRKRPVLLEGAAGVDTPKKRVLDSEEKPLTTGLMRSRL